MKARPDSTFIVSLLVPALLGFYLLLTSTTQLVPGIEQFDAKRILQLGLLLVLFLLSLASPGIRQEFGRQLTKTAPWLKLTLATVFLWGICSSLYHAQSPMHMVSSLAEVVLLFLLVLAVFLVAACRRLTGQPFDRIALGLIALTGLVVGVQELIGVAATLSAGHDFNFDLALMHFSWPRFYNQIQSWTVPVLAALPLVFSRYRMVYVLCLMVLGLHWYIILMTGARGSFVSIAAACIFATVLLPASVRSRLLTWQVSGLVFGAVIYAFVLVNFETGITHEPAVAITEQPQSFTESRPGQTGSGSGPPETESRFLDQSLGRPMAHTSGRSRMWSITLRDAMANPLLGIGPLNYVCTSPEWLGHPHNFPLQIAAEWGIPVALMICVIFLFIVYRVTWNVRQGRYDSEEQNVFAGLLLTGVIAAALHACLSGVMVMPASQVTGLLVCGMLLGLSPTRQAGPSGPEVARQFIPVLLLSLGLILSAGLILFGVNELRTMESRAATLHVKEALRPRFWQNSKVCKLYTM